MLSAALILAISGCSKKQGCTDYDALNWDSNAEENNGTCTYRYEKFIGTWTVSDTWSGYGTCSNGSLTYTCNIDQYYSDVFKVKLFNFAGLGGTDYILLEFDNYTNSLFVDDNYVQDGSSSLWHIISAYGTIFSDTHFQLNYAIENGGCSYFGTMNMTK